MKKDHEGETEGCYVLCTVYETVFEAFKSS